MSKNKKVPTRVVKKKKRSRRKVITVILSAVLLAFLLVSGYGVYLYTKADSVLSDSYEGDGRDKSDLRDEAVDPKFDNVSILLMGVDSSDERSANEEAEDSRTDTLMVATLNKDDKSVKLLSIPRDSYVHIPEVGYDSKINHAHAFGGTRAVIDTVENLLDIPIDYYMKVNFEAFIEVVDSVDGVTVDVPYDFSEMDSSDKANAIQLEEGTQELNGEEALALARTRKLDNDIERGKRQQEIIKAILDKTISLDSVLKYDDIIEAVGGNMTTNMTFSEMKSFISYGTSGTNLDLDTLTLDGYDYQPANVYYWQLDEPALQETRNILREHLDLEPKPVLEEELPDEEPDPNAVPGGQEGEPDPNGEVDPNTQVDPNAEQQDPNTEQQDPNTQTEEQAPQEEQGAY